MFRRMVQDMMGQKVRPKQRGCAVLKIFIIKLLMYWLGIEAGPSW
jgi:hypothetical protein